MTKDEFIAMVVPGAQQVQRDNGMFASVTVAQSIWETGWGKSVPVDIKTGVYSYNLFGRKASAGDPYVETETWEVVDGKTITMIAKFKKFNSYQESILDRSQFLRLKWYQKACNATDPYDAARFLIDTGYPGYAYATDPKYVDNLHLMMKSYNLTQYDLPKLIDEEENDMDKVLDYPDWAWTELDSWCGDAYNDKIISEWSWVQKIRDRKLTYKELLLLKILIDDRRRKGGA
jgi:flagellum-specific peptidoglycan hydrolase FlgJ